MKKTAIAAAASAAFLVSAGAQAEMRPVVISPANVMGTGQTAIVAGAAYEMGREAGGLEYDNISVGPVGVRHGLGDGFEAGAYLKFAMNDADDAGAPDESGLEGLTVYGKTALNANVAVEFGVTVGGSDEVAPYPNDGLDFFFNVPMQRRMGKGLLYGEFGYTIKDEIGAAGGFTQNYFNYGVGYAAPMNASTSLNIEMVGDEGGPLGLAVGNHMDLVFGVNTELQPGMRLAPYVSVGLYDASPDIALGVQFEARL